MQVCLHHNCCAPAEKIGNSLYEPTLGGSMYTSDRPGVTMHPAQPDTDFLTI